MSSLTTSKTPNEIAYKFSPQQPLDLLAVPPIFETYVARTNTADAISFVLANQKAHYNRNHQPIFMKVRDWAMLCLYKGYFNLSSMEVTKKLTQQYVGLFQIQKKVSHLAYKLDVLSDYKIYLLFSLAQFEPAFVPTQDFFHRPRPRMPPAVFINGDTDTFRSYKVDHLLNKQIIKKERGYAVEYLVCWTGYGPK